MMKPTAKLQFVRRRSGKDVISVLQQQWIDDDPPDEGAYILVWRDVPSVDEPSRSNVNECPSCRRRFKDGETCGMGGCPMGGDF